jgi:hypothetical protein
MSQRRRWILVGWSSLPRSKNSWIISLQLCRSPARRVSSDDEISQPLARKQHSQSQNRTGQVKNLP